MSCCRDAPAPLGFIARLDPSHALAERALRYRSNAAPVKFDLNESKRDLEEVFWRLFARPRGGEDALGWITEYEELTNELAVREDLAGEEAA